MNTIREATPEDADLIAEAHMDSIRALGLQKYSVEIVADWGKPRDGQRYRESMEKGETFFIALNENKCLGFSSLRKEDEVWRVAVYVRGSAARQGVGRNLFNAAEKLAKARNVEFIILDSSLVAAPFYKSCGFYELGQDMHRLSSGVEMACIKMRKDLKL